MRTEIITCDCCKKTISGGTWEDAPGAVHLLFFHPEQQYVSRKFDHVCYTCRQVWKKEMEATFIRLLPVHIAEEVNKEKS